MFEGAWAETGVIKSDKSSNVSIIKITIFVAIVRTILIITLILAKLHQFFGLDRVSFKN
jgi:hypothetical protein